jgi:hypothetical protein
LPPANYRYLVPAEMMIAIIAAIYPHSFHPQRVAQHIFNSIVFLMVGT